MLDRSAVSVCARAEHAIYRLAVERPSWCTRASQLHGRNSQPKIEHLRAFHDRDELACMCATTTQVVAHAVQVSYPQVCTTQFCQYPSCSWELRSEHCIICIERVCGIRNGSIPTTSSIADRICFRRDGVVYFRQCACACGHGCLRLHAMPACLPINLCNYMHV
jgi:hypothetical protein